VTSESHVAISHAYLGDGVIVLPGAQVGQAGFGFAGSKEGHGRNSAGSAASSCRTALKSEPARQSTRGALGDTVIGGGYQD